MDSQICLRSLNDLQPVAQQIRFAASITQWTTKGPELMPLATPVAETFFRHNTIATPCRLDGPAEISLLQTSLDWQHPSGPYLLASNPFFSFFLLWICNTLPFWMGRLYSVCCNSYTPPWGGDSALMSSSCSLHLSGHQVLGSSSWVAFPWLCTVCFLRDCIVFDRTLP